MLRLAPGASNAAEASDASVEAAGADVEGNNAEEEEEAVNAEEAFGASLVEARDDDDAKGMDVEAPPVETRAASACLLR